jgi:DNA-binding MarR family transcriptional regulator
VTSASALYLTESGKELLIPVVQLHAAVMKEIFSEIPPDELVQFEAILKSIGKRAELLAEDEGSLEWYVSL